MEPHVPDGIVEERKDVKPDSWGRAFISLRGGSADERINIAQKPLQTFALGRVGDTVEATDRAGPRNAWARDVAGQRQQLLARARRADGSRLQSLGEVLKARIQSAIPRFYLARRP